MDSADSGRSSQPIDSSISNEAGDADDAGEAGHTDDEGGARIPAETEWDGTAARHTLELAAAGLPAWRKAYLSNLIASGRKFASAGNGRGADYCFAKVEAALREAAHTTAADAAVRSSAPMPPVERVRRQWRLARIGQAEQVLSVHGQRLSALEKQSFRDRLSRLRHDADQPSQAALSDSGLLDLRRRMYQRVLRAQKIALLRRRHPEARRKAPGPRVSATEAAWQPVTGPYNDRANLEELISLIDGIDPAWVEEFLELYGSLAGLDAFSRQVSPDRK